MIVFYKLFVDTFNVYYWLTGNKKGRSSFGYQTYIQPGDSSNGIVLLKYSHEHYFIYFVLYINIMLFCISATLSGVKRPQRVGYQKPKTNNVPESYNSGKTSSKYNSPSHSFQASPVSKERKITTIKDLNPMSDSMAIKGRCISLWHSHKLREEHDPYSLDCVFQDVDVRIFLIIDCHIHIY